MISQMTMFFLTYWIGISLAGFFAMYLDKRRAIRHEWRIPEKTLFGLALLGGAAGTTLGMYAFRHKTKHWYFRFGMPLIFLGQLALFFFFVR